MGRYLYFYCINSAVKACILYTISNMLFKKAIITYNINANIFCFMEGLKNVNIRLYTGLNNLIFADQAL